ncbi:MAG: tRNA dihydrouridine(20/20a) synthase DusA, partial [Cypionkella sp.]
SDPADVGAAVRAARPYGYDEINLNVGCPSDRVQSGCFGAVLMLRPQLVADCVAAMQAASDVPVTVKCRIGVDDQNPAEALPAFLEAMVGAGVGHVIIHARKAWLSGLSPKENREIPPLDYDLVLAMKRAYPRLCISINGGVTSLAQAKALLERGLDGVMVGRAAYHDTAAVLQEADSLWGEGFAPDTHAAIDTMRPYIAAHLAGGGRLHQITRHMLGAFAGGPGARGWRRVLSTQGMNTGAGLDVLDAALAEVARAREDMTQSAQTPHKTASGD